MKTLTQKVLQEIQAVRDRDSANNSLINYSSSYRAFIVKLTLRLAQYHAFADKEVKDALCDIINSNKTTRKELQFVALMLIDFLDQHD